MGLEARNSRKCLLAITVLISQTSTAVAKSASLERLSPRCCPFPADGAAVMTEGLQPLWRAAPDGRFLLTVITERYRSRYFKGCQAENTRGGGRGGDGRIGLLLLILQTYRYPVKDSDIG